MILLKAYILFTSSLSSGASVVENVTDGSEALNFITEFVEKYMAGIFDDYFVIWYCCVIFVDLWK